MPPSAVLRPINGFPPSDGLVVARPRLPDLEALTPYLRKIDELAWYSNFGPLVRDFEARLAQRFLPSAATLTVANATLGLAIGLKALSAPEGALCAIPSWTFVATAHAVLQAGLIPWFVDVDPVSWMLDPGYVRDRLSAAPGRVAAVIPVCAFGQQIDMAAWSAFRRETGLSVLVDAAAAFDTATEASLPTVVSLHATKALGVGEGGFVACEDADFIERMQERTSFGFRGSRNAWVPATNAKMSEYTAAVGLAGLDLWPATRLRYAKVAQRLRIALMGTPEVGFQPGWGLNWVSSTCVVGLPANSADRIEARLEAQGIQTRRWWGAGCHRSTAFAGLPTDLLPVTEQAADSTLGVPYFADMTGDEVDWLAEALVAAVAQG
ncbi:MAG: DegT/DnrJ/EryC1/StrS aminotransferase [Phenylobacterium sp.]|jgi:dTDP-4-amino-4,6-dideoxygalactose transaminase|uniref:DegT/DnrJ/EryC1/StrS family aminotransferase n=1 Tax=Phenylobacterium sp. TaxID=1871053 RepID=UPI00261AB4F1|nr:DegT/DnrJ/EryC1/StrS family aminotransferase [Phenylobacterium sp.]MDB5499951.1 DegT/DnrJ/EryC1/StrS aminotransferase [Phenylobacterium sp.]